MNRIVVCALWGGILAAGGGSLALAADAGQEAEVVLVAKCSPDSVVNQLFTLLRQGDAPGAEKLFRIVGAAQQAAVRDYVGGGIKYFKKSQMNSRTLDVFTLGPYAICALEQTSPDLPGRRELEIGCLVLVDGCWRLLPQPQDYRSASNELSARESSNFDLLKREFDAFKKEYKKYYSANRR